jgi:hypothetical protein
MDRKTFFRPEKEISRLLNKFYKDKLTRSISTPSARAREPASDSFSV